MSEGKSTRALTGPRQLHKSFDPLNLILDLLSGQFEIQSNSSDWKFINPANTLQGCYVEDYFDTSGYTRDYLTTMPTQALFQEAGRWQYTQSPSTRMICLDLLMTDRIDDVTVFATQVQGDGSGIPSFPRSSNEWEQVIYGRFREFIGLTQGTAVQDVFSNVSDQQFGSLGATTADKIWIYRFIILLGIPSDGAAVKCPPFRPVLDINVEAESENAFMMRQKRSYELANY